jgi:hypothetical protein
MFIRCGVSVPMRLMGDSEHEESSNNGEQEGGDDPDERREIDRKLTGAEMIKFI